MFKDALKVSLVCAALVFAGTASASVISGSGASSAHSIKVAEKAARKALRMAQKQQRACARLQAKGRAPASCSAGISANYTLMTVSASAVLPDPDPATSSVCGTSSCLNTVSATDPGNTGGQTTAVPEPTTLALLGGSLLGMAALSRRRKLAALR